MRLISVVLSFVLCSPFFFSLAHANQMRMIVPFAAGGTADVLGRIVAQEFSALTGNQVVVENRPGSGGNIGADLGFLIGQKAACAPSTVAGAPDDFSSTDHLIASDDHL